MKNKGFTLTEILAVIIILGILITIATPVFFGVSNNTKKNELQTKIDYIKTKALKYAEEQGLDSSTTIITASLIADGYLTAEEYKDDEEYGVIPYIENPTDKEDNLACRIININMDGYEYKANVTDEANCDLINEENSIEKLGIRAFKYDESELGDELDLTNGEFDWTNTDVMLVVNPQYSDIVSTRITQRGTTLEVGNNKLTDPDNGRRIDKAYSNTIVVSTDSILKESINVTVQTESEVNNKTVVVQIDKEAPTVSSAVYDGWTKDKKSVTAYLNDGNGSGPDSVYLTLTNNKGEISEDRRYNAEGDGTALIEYELETGYYYLWAKDKAGNLSMQASEVKISTVDNTAPSCTESGMNTVWTRDSITIIWGCKDEESGCATGASGGSKTFSGGMTQSTYYIEPYTIKDNAGNETNCPGKIVDVYHDSEAPLCHIAKDNTIWTNKPVTVQYGCKDNGSGCITNNRSIVFAGSNAVKTSRLDEYRVTDVLGNSRTCSPTANVYYDPIPPTIEPIDNPLEITELGYNFKNNIAATDKHSGIKSIECTPPIADARREYGVVCIARDNAGNSMDTYFKAYIVYPGKEKEVTDGELCGTVTKGKKKCGHWHALDGSAGGGTCSYKKFECTGCGKKTTEYTCSEPDGNGWGIGDHYIPKVVAKSCTVYDCGSSGHHPDGSTVGHETKCYYN